MTCIVACKRNQVICLGGDSTTTSDYHQIQNRDAKVFRRAHMLFGTSGNPRLRNLLQFTMDIPEIQESEDPMSYLVRRFLKTLRDCFQEEGFLRGENGQESIDGRFIIALRQELYLFGRDMNITRPAHPYLAIGTGAEYAYGSLATTTRMDLEPQQCVQLALEAAALHCTDVASPFISISSE